MNRLHSIVAVAFFGSTMVLAQPAGIQQWLLDLGSTDGGAWRVAQIQLAHEGAAALSALEDHLPHCNDLVRKRVKQTVELMLLKSIEPETLKKHDALWKIVRSDIEHVHQMVKPLMDATDYDSGEPGFWPNGPVANHTPNRTSFLKATRSGGFAIPAALSLCNGKTAASRLYGAELHVCIFATSQRHTLEQMQTDEGKIAVFRGDFTDHTTVGKSVQSWLRSRHPFRLPGGEGSSVTPVDLAEDYLSWLVDRDAMPALVTRVRQHTKAREAKSWQEFWIEAQPEIKKYFAANHQ